MNIDLSMGEYGTYVWTCFALFGVMLVWDLLMPILRMRRLKRELALRQRRRAARASATPENPIP
jgi:heme exporter protein CcmD